MECRIFSLGVILCAVDISRPVLGGGSAPIRNDRLVPVVPLIGFSCVCRPVFRALGDVSREMAAEMAAMNGTLHSGGHRR